MCSRSVRSIGSQKSPPSLRPIRQLFIGFFFGKRRRSCRCGTHFRRGDGKEASSERGAGASNCRREISISGKPQIETQAVGSPHENILRGRPSGVHSPPQVAGAHSSPPSGLWWQVRAAACSPACRSAPCNCRSAVVHPLLAEPLFPVEHCRLV